MNGIEAEQAKWDAYYQQLGFGEAEETPAALAFHAEFAEVVLELFPERATALEAGCGAGRQALALAQSGRIEVSLLDLSPRALETARALFARAGLSPEATLGNVFEPGPPGHDLVFNAGVLEHYTLDQQAAFLRGMASRSRRYVLVLVPNRACYWYWAWRTKQSQAGNWPFGKECPMVDMKRAFQKAGVTFLGRTFLGATWTEDLLLDIEGTSPALRDDLLAIHRSGLIEPAQRCYLMAALGCVGPAPAHVPARWADHDAGDEMRTAELTAGLADALALRLAGEYQLRHAQQKARYLEGELAQARGELLAIQAFLGSPTYRLAERLRRLRLQMVPPHSWRASAARTLARLARGALWPLRMTRRQGDKETR